ncbi:MAG: radical SAM protein [Nanoarchaeota archaeon]
MNNSIIVLRKPKIIPRIVKNYCLMTLGKTVLRTIEIALTYDCQCRCKHCCCEDLKHNKKDELTTESIKNIIDQSIKLGAIHVLFTGGETLIPRNKLLEVIKHANKRNCISSIDTNGILLNKSYAQDLKKSGLDVACISLDYPYEKEHDKFREYNGCYAKTIDAITNCKSVGIEVIISTLLTKDKLRNGMLIKILDIAKSLDCSVIFCLPVLTGKWRGNKKERLDEQDILLLNEVMNQPLARLCEENNYFFKGCSAGSEKIAISLYGGVMPCSFIKNEFGNTKKDTLRIILKRMRKNKLYNKVNRKMKCLAAGI